MNTQVTNQEKPTLVNVIAWMTLISGIVNIIWGIAALSTFIGFICAPLSVLPIILGVFEVVYAAKLLSGHPESMKPSTNIAIFEILCTVFGNAFALVVGILSLVFYNDQDVRDYFARLNGTFVQVVPVSHPSMPEATPLAPEEITPAEQPSEPASEETPEKPKRSRKVAGK